MFTGFYVEVGGPYDGGITGPFATRADAEAREERMHDDLDPNVFTTCVMDHAEFVKRVAEFGPINIEAPDGTARVGWNAFDN